MCFIRGTQNARFLLQSRGKTMGKEQEFMAKALKSVQLSVQGMNGIRKWSCSV